MVCKCKFADHWSPLWGAQWSVLKSAENVPGLNNIPRSCPEWNISEGSGTFSKRLKDKVSLSGLNWRENADMSNVKESLIFLAVSRRVSGLDLISLSKVTASKISHESNHRWENLIEITVGLDFILSNRYINKYVREMISILYRTLNRHWSASRIY